MRRWARAGALCGALALGCGDIVNNYYVADDGGADETTSEGADMTDLVNRLNITGGSVVIPAATVTPIIVAEARWLDGVARPLEVTLMPPEVIEPGALPLTGVRKIAAIQFGIDGAPAITFWADWGMGNGLANFVGQTRQFLVQGFGGNKITVTAGYVKIFAIAAYGVDPAGVYAPASASAQRLSATAVPSVSPQRTSFPRYSQWSEVPATVTAAGLFLPPFARRVKIGGQENPAAVLPLTAYFLPINSGNPAIRPRWAFSLDPTVLDNGDMWVEVPEGAGQLVFDNPNGVDANVLAQFEIGI